MTADLIVFSHLRWTWVWQRPQHLISRIGRGRRIWFVEEPFPTAGAREPILRHERCGDVTRVWLEVEDEGRDVSFEEEVLGHYWPALSDLVGATRDRIVWLYSPLPMAPALALEPDMLVYDVMDDLASFKDPPPHLVERHRQVLRRADVVFAGGRSLHRGVLAHRPDAHLFPSGVEPEHYADARAHRRARTTPVAGYVGVIDERLDLRLVAEMAAALPDWEIQMVGPVTKIDPADLPTQPNVVYLGPQPYERLPEIMGGFDVALMPFALNEATRSISPTKTLEYLAAGLPVVATRVPDVVASFGTLVDFQCDAAGFADACRRVLEHDIRARDAKLRPVLHSNRWDTIAERMSSVMGTTSVAAPAQKDSA